MSPFLTVREAALPLTTGIPSAFYEDLPYATTHPSAATDLESLRESAEQRRESLSPLRTVDFRLYKR